MLRSYVVILLLLAVATTPAAAQRVTILSGGSASLQNGGQMGLPATLIVEGTFDAGGSVMHFEKDGNQTLTGSGALTLDDVVVNKPRGDLVLGTDVFVRGLLDVQQGDVDLNGFTIDLGATGTLSERLGQTVKGTSGTLTARRDLDGPDGVNVAGLGAEITTLRTLGPTVVTRGHAVQTGAGNEGIARYFDVSPTNNADLGATLTVHYDESEVSGLPEASLIAFRSIDGGTTWTEAGGTADPEQHTVTVTGIDAFSRWTLASSSTPLPVELTAFEATVDGRTVTLTWRTASETNNAGFSVERRAEGGERKATWEEVAWVEGAGTTGVPQAYTYRMRKAAPGQHRFRLKQIDFDGTFAYSPEVEVFVALSEAYVLTPPYPNPFNPQAQFSLMVKRAQRVEVAVFDALGRKVAVLFAGEMAAESSRALVFEASDLPSGLYLIRAAGETFVATRSVTLLK